MFMMSGLCVGDGDPAQAAKAILEVVAGEWVGTGKGTRSVVTCFCLFAEISRLDPGFARYRLDD